MRAPASARRLLESLPGRCRAGRTRGATLKKVAIKHIDRVFDAREDALRIVRELRFLRLLKHANVRIHPRIHQCACTTLAVPPV